MSCKREKEDLINHTQVNLNNLNDCPKLKEETYNNYKNVPDIQFVSVKQEILEQNSPVPSIRNLELKIESDPKDVSNIIIKQENDEDDCMEDSSLLKFDNADIKTEEVHIKCEEDVSCLLEPCGDKLGEKIEESHPATKTNHMRSLAANYKCSKCLFQTPYKIMLSSHMLRHERKITEDTLICNKCSYKTTEKRNFIKHFRRHQKIKKNESETGHKDDDPRAKITAIETKTHQCSQCEYRSGQIYNLKMHILRYHETLKDDDILKCPECIFQTLRPYDLKKHMLEHENAKKNKMLKCAECAYQSLTKSALRKHVVRHIRQEALTTYQCTDCSYQTKDRSNMRHHRLRHHTMGDFGVFICHDCGFGSKFKQILHRHILANKLDTILNHECRLCSFQTRYKCVLKKHLVCHKANT